MSLELRIELRMLGLMKAMVNNPVLKKETLLTQIGDAEKVASFKMRELMEKTHRSSSSIDVEKPVQSNYHFQNRVI